jgi:glucosamine--fructose-6-phosphate aminotransferase (isomerizing)
MKLNLGRCTFDEIMSQGKVWSLTLEGAQKQIVNIRSYINTPHDRVFFTGCGSTHYLALSAAKHWEVITVQPACGLPGSEIWLYPKSSLCSNNPILIAISRSGATSETLHAIEVFKDLFGKRWAIISCYEDSQMAIEAPYSFLTSGAKEESIAQTRSFSSMFLLTQYMAGVAANNNYYIDELKKVPEAFERLVKTYHEIVKSIAQNEKYQHFVFLGSGINYGIASETMLKMKEMSISISEAFHFMEFRHGPMSMITPNSLVIGLVNDTGRNAELNVLGDMKKLGASTLALIDGADGSEADYVVDLKSGVSELARGVLFLPVLQLLAYYRSISKGLNPDRPKNLEAVVYL